MGSLELLYFYCKLYQSVLATIVFTDEVKRHYKNSLFKTEDLQNNLEYFCKNNLFNTRMAGID